MPTLADLEYAYLASVGATRPSLADRRREVYGDPWSYFSARSGLTPAAKYTLADHQLAYYRSVTGMTAGSLADAQARAWAGVAPAVTVQPSTSPQSLAVDAVLSLTSAASGFPSATVKWQRSNNGGSSWTDIAGAVSPTLTHTLSAANGYATAQTWVYRAVWTNFAGTVPSNQSGVVTIS